MENNSICNQVKYEKIRESEYGDSPNNVHITRRGDTISIEPTYPNISYHAALSNKDSEHD